jgi:Mn-dependent DtxR family transcriptional regulator
MQFGLWKRPRVVAGRVYVIKGLGIIRVTAVEKIDLNRLTPWEAQAAGAKDVAQLRKWLSVAKDSASMGSGYRVRFRYLGPESKEGDGDAETEEGKADDATSNDDATSPVKASAIPADLMTWIEKRDWRIQHLTTLTNGIWRNADDISLEISADSATTRRRMGDLRKRGLVNSHRHHGYRITPEGMGAIAKMVDKSEGSAGASAAEWLRSKGGRTDLIEALLDGKWHNAGEVGQLLGLSVVSVQRRVAALRDRGLIESHRRRGYRLTDIGFEAIGMEPPSTEEFVMVPDDASITLAKAVDMDVAGEDEPLTEESFLEPKEEEAPIPGELLEWLDKKPYRKELILVIPPDEFISTSDLSEVLTTSITALHGRIKTLKDRGLVESLPRRGYKKTHLGARISDLMRAMAMRTRKEPEGAEAFLSAEPEGWSGEPAPSDVARVDVGIEGLSRPKSRWGATESCGFCHANATSGPEEGWVQAMQTHIESPLEARTKIEPIECRRGVIDDASWFLVVDRNPMAEGHCKLVCKEHVNDMLELAEWSRRDQGMAHARDSLSKDLLIAIEVITALDPRIVDVMVLSGHEYGAHLHFDLIPRYRMDLPGLRPLASSKAFYDDMSLARKRRLWQERQKHLDEVADKLRAAARGILPSRGPTGMTVTELP